jgi:hypothetical protein
MQTYFMELQLIDNTTIYMVIILTIYGHTSIQQCIFVVI